MTTTDEEILRRLEEREREEGKLPLLLEFYQKLLHIQSRAKKRIVIPKASLSSQTISKRIEQGVPLISFDDLSLDWTLLQDVFVEVIAAFAGYPQLFGEIPDSLRDPKAGSFLTEKTVQAWFENAELPLAISANAISKDLLQGVFQATLRPFLQSYSEALIGSIDQERWRRRYCPICGGSPDFSYLDKERGSRWLLCSRCDTEWVFQRLACPFCGCQDQSALGYLTDEAGLYRLYTCQNCQNYLKAIDLRKTEENILLPLERLLTLDMDRQAREKGFGNR